MLTSKKQIHSAEIVAEGTPEEVAKVKRSHTGKYLRGCLSS